MVVIQIRTSQGTEHDRPFRKTVKNEVKFVSADWKETFVVRQN
jgi:hypothetical protein